MYFGAKSANQSQNNSTRPCEEAGGNRYFLGYHMNPYVLFHSFDVFPFIVESTNKEKPLNE
jgi:hypothetical protein